MKILAIKEFKTINQMTLKDNRYYLDNIPHCPKERIHQYLLKMNHFGKLWFLGQINPNETPAYGFPIQLEFCELSYRWNKQVPLISVAIYEMAFFSNCSEVYQSDSSLVNIDEILLSDNEEFRQDDIDDLLKSSGDELCPVNMERTNDDGYNEILISQDEIEIVDVKKGLN